MNLQSPQPINNVISVTPNDSTDLTKQCRALYVGAAGNVKVDTVGGETVTLTALAAGVWHPIAVKRVHSTDTTATSILAGY